jgi:hypothetical protein
MFNQDRIDPKLVQEAKRLAGGPLGDQIAKFPLKFAGAICYGEILKRGLSPDIRNGTATIVDFGSGPIIITAQHVMQGYKDRLKEGKDLLFQIGNLKIDPIPRIISESKKYDLTTLKIEEKERKEIALSGEIGKDIYQISSRPPTLPTVNDWVTFGGFPGTWRQHVSWNELVFDSFSVGPCNIGSVSEDKFICQFEREYWMKSFDYHGHGELHDLGGLSGAPVFLIRNIRSGIISFEFVGIVLEFNPRFDLMVARSAKYIRKDGSIVN